MQFTFLKPSSLPRLASLLIALCALSSVIWAQNASNIPVKEAQADAPTQLAEQAERERIAKATLSLQAELEQQRQACYQKLAVTPCLNQLRDEHSEQMRDLKRQEVSLNDAKRKQVAADRLRAVDERNSPQAQLAQAERRGRALEASSRREEAARQRQAKLQARQAQLGQSANTPAPAKEKKPLLPQAAARAPRANTPRVVDPAELERNRQESAQREQAAQARRLALQEREANRKKPPAAPLPIPQ
jgi:colicin import membrane protein